MENGSCGEHNTIQCSIQNCNEAKKKQKKFDINYIHIYITRKCNLECLHCFTNSHPKLEHELEAVEWEKIAADIGQIGVRTVHIEGGEPLIYPGINDVIKSLADNKVKDILMVTNGLSASEEKLKSLMNSGLNRIAVSLDSIEESVHNELRGNSFKYAKKAILTAIKLGMKTRVSSVLTQKTVYGLKDLIDFAVDSGVSALNIDWFNGVGRGKDLISLYQIQKNDKDLIRILENAVIHFLKKGRTGMTLAVDLPGWLQPEDTFLVSDTGRTHFLECDAVKNQISIGPDGSVYPCFIYSNGGGSIGNLRDRSLSDILSVYPNNFKVRCPIGATSHKFYYCG